MYRATLVIYIEKCSLDVLIMYLVSHSNAAYAVTHITSHVMASGVIKRTSFFFFVEDMVF